MLSKKLPIMSSVLIFLYSVTLLISGKSYAYIAIPLCIASLVLLPHTLKGKLPADFYKIAAALVSYFLVTALSLFLMGGKLSNLDMPSRTILILPIFIFLLKYPPRKEWLFMGIIVGSILSGLIALYHTQVLNIRAFYGFDYMVIQSGDMAMSLGIFSLIIAIHYIKEKNKILMLLAMTASFAGIMASLLSGARGGWIIMPIVLVGLLIVNRKMISNKIAMLIILILISSSFLSYNIAEKRVQELVTELSEFTEQHQTNTSTGIRIELWKSGVYSFLENPVFGTGYQDRREHKLQQIEKGLVDPVALMYGRLHNSYLEELSIKGSIGFVALMLFFGVPLYLFVRRGDIKNCVFAQLGIAHIILVMGYCLTQNYINHHSGMLHYLMYTIIFYAMLYQQLNTSARDETREM
jgi:O-antigen ligase